MTGHSFHRHESRGRGAGALLRRGWFAVIIAAACREAPSADAYGNFEADDVVVSSEVSGPLVQFTAVEGTRRAIGDTVARVDTVAVALERAALEAQRRGLVAHRAELAEQLRVLAVQHEVAARTRARIERLFAQEAATAVQRDAAEREARTLAAQMEAARASIARATTEVSSLDARIAQVTDRLGRAVVTNPVDGAVLATFVRAGEIVQQGQPLYRIANLDTLTLRVYVTGGQLGDFRVGSTVDVHIDAGNDSLRTYEGLVTWVAAQAEFTPTPVQTREERGDLVYAVKVRVANPDGRLKIGMPADVTFTGRGAGDGVHRDSTARR